MNENEKNVENVVDAMQTDTVSTTETDMKIETCDIASNTNMDHTKNKGPLQPPDSSVIISKEDILRTTCPHLEKKHDVPTIIESGLIEVKTTTSEQTKCVHYNGKAKSADSCVDQDPISSLQDVQDHFSPGLLALPGTADRHLISEGETEGSSNGIPKSLINKEEDCLPEIAGAVILKQSHVSSDTYSSCSDAISNNPKQCKSCSRRAKDKSPVSSFVAQPSLPVTQGCTSGNAPSLSSFSDERSLMKITDETVVKKDFMPLVEEEDNALTSTPFVISCESGTSPDFISNPVIIENNSSQHKEMETESKEFLDSQCRVGSDPAADLNQSSAGDVILDLVDQNNFEASTKNIDAEDSSTRQSISDISKNEGTNSFNATSEHWIKSTDGHPSILTETSLEKEPDKGISSHLCDIELVHKGSSNSVSQVTDGSGACHSGKASASEEVKKSRDEVVKPAMHEEITSVDAVTLPNKDLTDHSGKVPEASVISAEGNLKSFSSPIRGLIHDFISLAEPNEKNMPNSFRKEEVTFSFPTEENFHNDSEKECSCIESNDVLSSIGKNDDFGSVPSCIASGTINGLENGVTSLTVNHAKEDGSTSDLIDCQDKNAEAVILILEKNLISRRRRKLLVLDLNGLLADIILDIRNVHRAQKKVGGKTVFKRPFCDDFLKFCFETFDIGVWSSRRKYNVDSVLDFIMGDCRHKLLFCWDQSHCTYTGLRTLENVHKPLVLKELKKLWQKEEADLPWEKGDYSPSNTLLVDDSPYKALRNPPNTGIFPHPYRFDDEKDASLGPGGDLRVYLEGLALADDVQLYVQEHPFGQQAITNSDPSWDFYLQVIEKGDQSLASTN